MRDENVGHTVVDGELAHLSVSSCEKASPRHGGCYRRWHYDKVMGDKEPERDASKVAKQKGIDMHDRLAHYLTTGENILQAPEIKGIHMLPTPGPDLWVEQAFHRVVKYDERQPDGSWKFGLTRLESSLYAAGIPFVGYIDFAHGRLHTWTEDEGHIVDPVGTIEVGDHKFKSNAKDRDGNFTYKQPGELVKTIQMAGYGKVVANTQPHATHVRLSHLYYPEKGDKPRKVTRLHVLDDCQRTWEYVEALARSLKDVARETNVDKVDANVQACDLMGGCPYRSKCKAYRTTSLDNLWGKVADDFNKETTTMGLLTNNPQIMQTQAQPQQAPQPQPDFRAQLAAEEAQLKAQQVQQQAQMPNAAPPQNFYQTWTKLLSFGRGQPTLGGAAAMAYAMMNGYQLPAGGGYSGTGDLARISLQDPAHVAQLVSELEAAAQQQPMAAPQVQVTHTPQATTITAVGLPGGAGGNSQAAQMLAPVAGGLLPPGAPGSQPQLAQQQVAPPVQQTAPTQAEPEKVKRGRGRPKKNDSGTPPEAAGQTTQPAQIAVTQPTSAQPTPAPAVTTQVTPATVPTSPDPRCAQSDDYSFGQVPMILINARSLSENTRSLAGYVDYINEKLARKYNTTQDGQQGPLDVRMAVPGSILGYGGWKGGVREAVLADPPPPGRYHFDTFMNELNEVVADALRPLEAKGWLIVRGVR